MSALHQRSGHGQPHAHLVQFYGNDAPLLARNVGRYLTEGLRRGDSVVGILTSQNATAVMQELKRRGVDAGAATRSGRLVIRDAEKTLGQFLVEEWPDADRFHTTIYPLVKAGREQSGTGICRAYGEMVGVLWQTGKTAAAVHLEELWNRLLEEEGSCELMCGYPIDVFEENFDKRAIGPILLAHTALISAAPDGDLRWSVDRAMEEAAGERLRLRRAGPENVPHPLTQVPKVEARLLALRRENFGIGRQSNRRSARALSLRASLPGASGE